MKKEDLLKIAIGVGVLLSILTIVLIASPTTYIKTIEYRDTIEYVNITTTERH